MRFCVFILPILLSLPAAAVKPLQPPGIHLPQPQHSPADKAGYIFSGTVKSMVRIAPKTNGVAVMQITFHVDEGLRGTHSGQTLTIREWAGLWQGDPRYRAGERVMLFLYPPSKLGLTSPVGGAAGRFEVDPRGRVIIEPHKVTLTKTHLPENLRMGPGEFLRTLRREEDVRGGGQLRCVWLH